MSDQTTHRLQFRDSMGRAVPYCDEQGLWPLGPPDALRAVERYFGITDDLEGNGCEHGFKPAKACPNGECPGRRAHLAWLAFTDDSPPTWQPIETAPADQQVLVVVQYPERQRHVTFGWRDEAGRWYGHGIHQSHGCQVHCWMPMPAVPDL